MLPEVARQLEALWDQGEDPPPIFELLRPYRDSDPTQLVAVLLQDQKHRWKTDRPLRVEEYLAEFPGVANDPKCKLQLAVGEFDATRSDGALPRIQDFVSRFPEIRDPLRSRLLAIESTSDETLLSDAKDIAGTSRRQGHLDETFITDPAAEIPSDVRYVPKRILGEGGYGRVYLAFDRDLRRDVAVKVPTTKYQWKPGDVEIYLDEARTVARLDHPNVVPVYDMGRTDDGSIFVVSKFIEGYTLRHRMIDGPLEPAESAAILATIAMGLDHAHQRRIIHRDVKPGNILIEQSTGIAYVADFGLAIRNNDPLEEDRIVGTPAYMSPEQARGESHRLDGRSDIFSLGIIMYEILGRRKPFRGSTSNEVLHEVVSIDPPKLRDIDESIPAELERICMKALSKRASDRYATAADFAQDLLSWQDDTNAASDVLQVIPKGLRSFDADDASFFLDLIPGPRSRDGLPETIRFWKNKIEETDAEKTFNVGLIYGPSGCGKSSMVKAGLLPRLESTVTAIYLEATAEDTELRILRGLQKKIPDLPRNLELVETFSWLRRQVGRKTVVVLDQFEQWLHANRADYDLNLVRALRQCDGEHLQSIVMVRDDFSMAASRFMRELETPILEGHNFATVDLFDVAHAADVLTKFGQSFGRLPVQEAQISNEQRQFVDAVANGLANDGKVVSVRLALFAEMIKGKPWLPGTLAEVGGTDGIGTNFLEEMFGNQNANPEHLRHQQAARQVLMALLPEVGTDIKGHMRSHAELLDASGYRSQPREFNDLLRILDGKMRLITPTDPEGFHSESNSDRSLKFYQLTHDYLVPSLRAWLTRKQVETLSGRASLALAERSAVWNAKPERRHLPSSLEWARIKWFTDKMFWSEPQRKMMASAGTVHGVRFSVFTLVSLIMLAFGLHVRDRVVQANSDYRTTGLLTAITNAKIDQLPDIIVKIRSDRSELDQKLRADIERYPIDSNERLNLSLALLPSDASQLRYLSERLLDARADQVEAIRDLLVRPDAKLVDDLWNAAKDDPSGDSSQLLPAVSALATYDPGNEANWNQVAQRVTDALVKENSLRVSIWINLLRPARRHLIAPLASVYRDESRNRSQSQIRQATDILEDYAADDLDVLSELLFDGQPYQFESLFDAFARMGDPAKEKIEQELDRKLKHVWPSDLLGESLGEPDSEVKGMVEKSNGIVADRFAMCQSMPIDDMLPTAELLGEFGYRPTRIRPYFHQSSIFVAVAWTRDRQPWRMVVDESAESIRAMDVQFQAEGFMPVDVSGYVNESTGFEGFAAVWRDREKATDDTRLYVDVRHVDVASLQENFANDGFPFAQSLQGFRGLGGFRKYCGVVSSQDHKSTVFLSQSRQGFGRKEYFDRIYWDIDLGLGYKPPSARSRTQVALRAADDLISSGDSGLKVRFERGKARFELGFDDEAIDDFDAIIDQLSIRDSSLDDPNENRLAMLVEALRCRSVIHARASRSDAAKADFESFVETTSDEREIVFLETVLAAHLADDAGAVERFEEFIDTHDKDGATLFLAAKTHAILAATHRERDASRSRVHADRAISLLTAAVENGFDDFTMIRDDVALEPICEAKGFEGTLKSLGADLRIASVWNTSNWLESRISHGLSPQEQIAQARQYQADGFRIAAVTAVSDGNDVISASIWHRPNVADVAVETLARRQANAAIAKIRLGEDKNVWRMLKESPDPRLRTWILHRLGQTRTSPSIIAERLSVETDLSVRRVLILSLGLYQNPTEIDIESVSAQLEVLYQLDPDPGIHSAAEWALRRWGKLPKLSQMSTELIIGSSLPSASSRKRTWSTTVRGLTMVSLPGPVEFVMGSPPTQPSRSTYEMLHRNRIDRHFAIAAREITVEQFHEFIEQVPSINHTFTERDAPDATCPQTSVTWYEAAAYCRWLSEQEGVPEDQMCYPPIPEIKNGMVVPDDYLGRTGYRLPTEAEWEYACRAGTRTSRHYGNCDELLDQYAWFSANSEDRTRPVGTLMPNDFGLFDMHGNVQEWCQERHRDYGNSLGSTNEDVADIDPVTDTVRRVLRGGSFGVRGLDVRSAARSYNRPPNRYNNSGFRPARTEVDPTNALTDARSNASK
ncbi:Serine/threonine-protein kinase PknB [Rubripirellula tenax]|uniref:Serine/threonine-protein kinase PknB n=1 Tax=Rubripirellula tenax TaxID=2528015 RepID=A0A5C6EL55_9BACT|nr:SUMF1/EgtB/PvdO family nonheme iron enzyme [Rubripirellula tenax]TWU48847.1 Serine/threonine-protein kinase PknB [Rubripirellula tenax]